MPTKIEEYSLYAPGRLVMSRKDLYSSTSVDGDNGNDEPSRVATGTVGMIIQGPNTERQAQYQVQFVKNIVWWVNTAEIEPYIK